MGQGTGKKGTEVLLDGTGRDGRERWQIGMNGTGTGEMRHPNHW